MPSQGKAHEDCAGIGGASSRKTLPETEVRRNSGRLRLRWPRLLPEQEAAEYVGVSVSQFRAEVERGIWPKPVARGCHRNTYDRAALDTAVDRLSRVDEPNEEDLIRGAREWGKSR